MAKSPKKSRRGRRSPKKNSQKKVEKISKEAPVQQLQFEPEIQEAEEVQEQPLPDAVPTAKEMLTHFFASLNEEIQANAWSLSQLPEQQFIFGKLASMFAANGTFGDEVEANFAVVWKADETWTRSLLAGEVKPPEPEPVVEEEPVLEPEAAMEPEAVMEEEAPKEPEPIVEPVMEPEAAIEPEAVLETAAVQEPVAAEAPMAVEEPAVLEVTEKENATNVFEDAGKIPFANKLGEQSPMNVNVVEGLAPKDVNVQPLYAQPMDLA